MPNTSPAGGPTVDQFVAMSAELTGFPADVIAPTLDPADLKTAYFAYAGRHSSDLPKLVAQYLAIKGQPPDQIVAALLAGPQATLARQLILMWYFGVWYPNLPASDSAVVVSSKAYVGGLAWEVAQAHPMGYSTLSFGYWSQPPTTVPPVPAGDSGGQRG